VWWTASGDGIVLRVRAVPGARRSEIVGVAVDELRVKVAAPAVEGAANEELRRVLAAWLGVRPAAVTLVRGARSRSKSLHVAGVDRPPPLSEG
jgi:hypothetical protein